MKMVLTIVAAIGFIGPVAGWAYIVALACGYKINSADCGVRLEDFWDGEFLMLAALPWLVGIISLFFASRIQ